MIVMPKINSRDKGARGEREFAAFLRSKGWEAKRGQQHAGGTDSPDVIHNVPDVHFEIKRDEALRLHAAMAQAQRDCGDKVPVVAHRRNRGEWLVTLSADDWLEVLRDWQTMVDEIRERNSWDGVT